MNIDEVQDLMEDIKESQANQEEVQDFFAEQAAEGNSENMEELEEMMRGMEEEEAMKQMGEMDIVPQGHIESTKPD